MAEFREERERNKTEEHRCPPGYHWVNGYFKKSFLGLGSYQVKGHCAKDSEASRMNVVEQKTTTTMGIPIFLNRETTITEEPSKENQEESD